jgi:16S rRNA (guanine527-N7)-methyltransferase
VIEALADVAGEDVPRETLTRLRRYEELLRCGAAEQNLIADSTLDALWLRHIADSAQLARYIPREATSIIDIGSGAGLPGIPLAVLRSCPITLLEPRRLRAEFLRRVIDELELGHVSVVQSRVETHRGRYDVITGRAVAALDRFLAIAVHLSHSGTLWVLPKGRSAETELEVARRSWHCSAELEPSCTDPHSRILLLRGVGKRS